MPDGEVLHLPETLITSTRVHEGRVVNLRLDEVRMPDGRAARREVVEHRGAVAIVALLPGPKVVLVRQWRHPAGRALTEIPAGTLSPGEEPLECARRELIEETGYAAGHIVPLVSFFSAPGFSTEVVHVFLARDLMPAHAPADDDERIEPLLVDWNEAVAMCTDGRIADAKSIAGILAADRVLALPVGGPTGLRDRCALKAWNEEVGDDDPHIRR